MQKTIVKLLIVQIEIAIVLILLALLVTHHHFVLSIGAGALMSILITMMIWLIIRRAPVVLRARTFYTLMWICEIIKWLMVMVLTTIFIRMRLEALGLVLGFALTYLGGYWTMLKLK